MKKVTTYHSWFAAFGLLLLSVAGCHKSDHFYTELKTLLQIDQRTGFAYKAAYITGDTMVITGLLKPINSLQITIGGVTAGIVGTDSVKYQYAGGNGPYGIDYTYVNQVKIVITQAMEGKNREVKLSNNGTSISGPAVDVFSFGGPGSFQDSLQLVTIKTFADSKNSFLYNNNGKGDLYYYAAGSGELHHIGKDGSEAVVFDLNILNDQFGNYTISSFITGGVNPQGSIAYFSVIAGDGSYKLLRLDLTSKQLTTLNQSTEINAPFEGKIDQVKMIINGIYPDSKGNVYLGISSNSEGKTPNAIALYTENSGQLVYLFRMIDYALFPAIPGMPGIGLQLSSTNKHLQGIRISPEENLLYALTFDNGIGQGGISLYDLSARVKLDQFQPNLPASADNGLDILGAFSSLRISWSTDPDRCFGFLPMPGKRLQTMQYQFYGPYGADPATTAQYGLPKWTVVDFTEQRIYASAPGRCRVGNFAFGPYNRFGGPSVSATDQLLNYDEAGHLYMTANGKTVLVKTQVIN
jgi:hypothetical protein